MEGLNPLAMPFEPDQNSVCVSPQREEDVPLHSEEDVPLHSEEDVPLQSEEDVPLQSEEDVPLLFNEELDLGSPDGVGECAVEQSQLATQRPHRERKAPVRLTYEAPGQPSLLTVHSDIRDTRSCVQTSLWRPWNPIWRPWTIMECQ